MSYKDAIKKELDNAKDPIEFLEQVKEYIDEISPLNHQPINRVRWVELDQVQANDYNPNSVAKTEMKLLYTSISHDGYTQPVVTVYDEKKNKYVIVDGFHRYFTSKRYKDISEKNHNRLPVVVIDKDINDRMASTIRHNRARGKHSVSGMSNIVFEMLDNGWEDVDILKELGMEAEELIRLKHITGFSKLFEDTEYKQSWELKKQLQIKKKYKDENPKEKII